MAIIHESFSGYSAISPRDFDIEAIAQCGVAAIFRARSFAKLPYVLQQMERRERIVFLLLDGRRTLHEVAHLTHHDDLEVAQILASFLARGYIDFLGTAYTMDE